MVGGSVEFFLLLGTSQAALVAWASVQMPMFFSPLYLGIGRGDGLRVEP